MEPSLSPPNRNFASNIELLRDLGYCNADDCPELVEFSSINLKLTL